MAPEIEGHHVVVAPQQLGQLVQVGLCGVSPGHRTSGRPRPPRDTGIVTPSW